MDKREPETTGKELRYGSTRLKKLVALVEGSKLGNMARIVEPVFLAFLFVHLVAHPGGLRGVIGPDERMELIEVMEECGATGVEATVIHTDPELGFALSYFTNLRNVLLKQVDHELVLSDSEAHVPIFVTESAMELLGNTHHDLTFSALSDCSAPSLLLFRLDSSSGTRIP